MGLFRKKMPHTAGGGGKKPLPPPIAIIMDGKGRWAEQRLLPRTAGPKAGGAGVLGNATHC